MGQVDYWENCGDGGGTGLSLSMEENEMANETPKENVMTVEFAIKRELAYRLRMEKLQSKPSGDIKIKEAPTATRPQGLLLSPRSSMSGMKRKATSSNLHCFPQSQQAHSCQPLQNQPVNLSYKVCQVACSSLANFKQRSESSKHKTKLEELVERQNGREYGKSPLWCKLCEVPCSCETSFSQHLAGKKHAARVQSVGHAKRARDEVEGEAVKFKWDEVEWEMVS